MLLKQGLNYAVASYLGHANVSMTLDIYADVDPLTLEVKMSAVDKIEACFDGYNGSRTMPAVNSAAINSCPQNRSHIALTAAI